MKTCKTESPYSPYSHTTRVVVLLLCAACYVTVRSPWPRPFKPKQNANRTLPEEASLDRVDNSIATLSQAVRLAAGFSCFHLSRHDDAHSQQRAIPLAACSRQGRTVPTLTCVATVDWLIGARALRIAMAPRGKPRAAPARKNVTPLRSGTRASTVHPSAMVQLRYIHLFITRHFP